MGVDGRLAAGPGFSRWSGAWAENTEKKKMISNNVMFCFQSGLPDTWVKMSAEGCHPSGPDFLCTAFGGGVETVVYVVLRVDVALHGHGIVAPETCGWRDFGPVVFYFRFFFRRAIWSVPPAVRTRSARQYDFHFISSFSFDIIWLAHH